MSTAGIPTGDALEPYVAAHGGGLPERVADLEHGRWALAGLLRRLPAADPAGLLRPGAPERARSVAAYAFRAALADRYGGPLETLEDRLPGAAAVADEVGALVRMPVETSGPSAARARLDAYAAAYALGLRAARALAPLWDAVVGAADGPVEVSERELLDLQRGREWGSFITWAEAVWDREGTRFAAPLSGDVLSALERIIRTCFLAGALRAEGSEPYDVAGSGEDALAGTLRSCPDRSRLAQSTARWASIAAAVMRSDERAGDAFPQRLRIVVISALAYGFIYAQRRARGPSSPSAPERRSGPSGPAA